MKKNIKEYITRLLLLFVGLMIAHLGVTLFLLSDMGADPFNVLIQGLHNIAVKAGAASVTHGMVHMAVCFLIIIILLAADKSYIKAGTVVCMVFGGPIIDFFTWVLSGLGIGSMHTVMKFLILIIGCVVLAFGMTIVIRSEAGTGPNDLVAVVISDKSGKKFGIIRMITDCVFVAAGAALGGKFGIGTLICAFLVGPVADIFMPLSSAIVKKGLSLMKIPTDDNAKDTSDTNGG